MNMAECLSKKEKPLLSFELFPPRNEKAAANLEKAIDKFAGLKPDFVTVTFGAGGSTREGSYQLVEKLLKEKGLNVIAYLAGYGMAPDQISSVLDAYRDLGVKNLFVIRGDKPEKEGFTKHPESLSYASDMLAYIAPEYDFCLGAAGYPEGHQEAESLEKDIEYLKLKVQNGAKFIIAQYFYDNKYFYRFLEKCEAAGIDVPILPGVMPIYSIKMTENLARTCGATITEPVREGFSKLDPEDKKAVVQFGIDFMTTQCADLLKHGVPGLHFYTMDRAKSIAEVIERLRKENLI